MCGTSCACGSLLSFFSSICFHPCVVLCWVLGDGCGCQRCSRALVRRGITICVRLLPLTSVLLRRTAHRQCVRSAKADKDENKDENAFAALDEEGMYKARYAYSWLFSASIHIYSMYTHICEYIYVDTDLFRVTFDNKFPCSLHLVTGVFPSFLFTLHADTFRVKKIRDCKLEMSNMRRNCS